jgi:hypothetical protein
MVNGRQLSGSRYVQLLYREDQTYGPTEVVAARNCHHAETLCTDCVDQWLDDYDILPTTNAGRSLLAALA